MKQSVLLFTLLLFIGWTSAEAQSMADGEMAPQSSFAQALAVQDGQIFASEPDLTHFPGLVYIYDRDGAGEWEEIGRVEAEDGEVGNEFGTSIAVHGSRMLVGAPGAEPYGAVYVFEQDGAGEWSQSAKLAPEDSVESFGYTLALSDDAAFVGAPRHGDDSGVVYVFSEGADGSWELSEELIGSDVDEAHRFGGALAVENDQLLIGSPGANRGAVYAFSRVDGSWSEDDRIAPSQLSPNARFGSSLQIADGFALIGSPRNHGGTGSVLTYEFEDGEWNSVGQLNPYDGMGQAIFGSTIAYDGSHLWVGAPGADSRTGAIYRYTRDAEDGNWTNAERMRFDDAQQGDRLGSSLAGDANVVVSGLAGAHEGAGLAAVFTADHEDFRVAQATLLGDEDMGLQALTGEELECEDGQVGPFQCDEVTLLSFLPTREIGGARGMRMNDVWGWTDPETGQEIAMAGRMDGMAFIDVTDPVNPVYLGNLPLTEGANPSAWRDPKVYQGHAYIVADNAGEHGMQIFDLTQLRDINPDEAPLEFEPTAIYDNINSAHNMVINEATGYGYIVGASGGGETCGGGLHMIDLENPTEPEFLGCFADPRTGRSGTGYVHDAQCVVYEGPDERYHGEEICFGANETALSIANVTDKDNPIAISIGSYPTYGYTHQGWLDEDQRYFYINDELDELNEIVDNTRTLIWDVSNLEDPQLVEEFFHETTASTHNLYIKDNLMYQSNYTAGLRVLDITDRENPVVVGYFDTAPYQEGPGFDGSWGNYPYFESGTIVVSSGNEGIFFVRPEPQPPVSDAR